MLLGRRFVPLIQLLTTREQVLAESPNCVFVPTVLFEATALVENVVQIFGGDEQVRQDVDPFGVVAAQAGLSSRSLLGLLAGGDRGPRPEQERDESNRGAQNQATRYAYTAMAHSGILCPELHSFASDIAHK